MNVKTFFEKYDFEDSNLNSVVNKDNNLFMEIDLCNWRQTGYNKSQVEVSPKTIIFKNVKKAKIKNNEKYDDGIVEAHLFKLSDGKYKIRLITENGCRRVIEFICNDVEMM